MISVIEAHVLGLSKISCATKKSSSTMAPSMLQSWASTRAPTTPSPAPRTTRLWRCPAQLAAPLFHLKITTTPMFPIAARGKFLQVRVSRLFLATMNPATRSFQACRICGITLGRFILRKFSSAITSTVRRLSHKSLVWIGTSRLCIWENVPSSARHVVYRSNSLVTLLATTTLCTWASGHLSAKRRVVELHLRGLVT